eukprot:6455994-Amphidinium_carterae.1
MLPDCMGAFQLRRARTSHNPADTHHLICYKVTPWGVVEMDSHYEPRLLGEVDITRAIRSYPLTTQLVFTTQASHIEKARADGT